MDERTAAGEYLHGEADFVQRYQPHSVLDAGCGTGRIGIELASRGVVVAGVDLDPEMIEVARDRGPQVTWHVSDLAEVDLERTFDVVLAAGNVMIFLTPGSQAQVIARLAAHIGAGGRLVTGFALRGGPSGFDLDLSTFDAWCTGVGLNLRERFATWDRDPYRGGDYAVSVHSQ